MMQTPVVLASTSPTRRRLLQAAGFDLAAVPPRVDEDALRAAFEADQATPRDIADSLAEGKAIKVSRSRAGALVIGSDQTLDLDGRCLSKAASEAEARDRLRRLRGRCHKLHTAAVIAVDGVPVWRFCASATLSVRTFSDAWLDWYMARNWPDVAGSVGAYHVEGEGVLMFDRIDGDWFAIQGLPLIQIVTYLGARGDILT